MIPIKKKNTFSPRLCEIEEKQQQQQISACVKDRIKLEIK